MKKSNALIHEDSPYLRQHAHNPVNWMAWNAASFEKAKNENKLIFLSIGYSTCHWCHVMERETFEDEVSASLLNADYVSIKVDREEMPDVDKYYQDIHYLLTKRSGGWPLSMIMTPDQKVIFAATYLPPLSANGRMGFRDLVTFIKDKFHNEFEEIQKSAKSIEDAIKHFEHSFEQKEHIDKSVIDVFVANVKASFDDIHKGIGDAPKFPHASTFNTLIDIYKQTGSLEALYMSEDAIEAMASGGIFDQIEGGFYRYSVDAAWVIPHFEKMLYTNAELIEVCAKLYGISPKPLFKETFERCIEAMDERFLKEGLYLSASDADSEGDEGKYFVFKYQEAKERLLKNGFDDHEAEEVLAYFSITKAGNFEEGLSNPCINIESEKPPKIEEAFKLLKELRQGVAYPFIDTKVLTSWNALMVTSLFEAGKIEKRYTTKAQNVLDKLCARLHVKSVLYHQLVLGGTLKVEALLEDYAFLIEALIIASNETDEKKYLELAVLLSDEAMAKFYKNGIWYLSDKAFKAKAPLEDSSYKSAMAVMIKNIFELSKLNHDNALHVKATMMLENVAGSLKKYPHAYPEAIKSVLFYM